MTKRCFGMPFWVMCSAGICARGQLRLELKQLAEQTYQDHRGRPRRVAYKTLKEWFYKYRHGFAALKPRPRSDRNRSRVLAEDLQQLALDMKREDPGRSASIGKHTQNSFRVAQHHWRQALQRL